MKATETDSLNDELLAVIAAAVAASFKKPGIKLVVRSFKRLSQDAPVWNIAGRLERIEDKLN